MKINLFIHLPYLTLYSWLDYLSACFKKQLHFTFFLLTLIGSFPIAAIEETESPENLKQRTTPLNEVDSWLTIMDRQRTPSWEKPIIVGPRRGLIPPEIRMTGFTPKLSVSTEARDNVTFSASQKTSDISVIVSPGLSYNNLGRKWNFQANYFLESAYSLNNQGLTHAIDTQSVSANGGYAITPRTRINFSTDYFESRDPQSQEVTGLVIPETSNNTNMQLKLFATYDLSSFSSVNMRIGYSPQTIESNITASISETEGQIEGVLQLGEKNIAGISYRYRDFNFSPGNDEYSQTVWLNFKHKYSPRVLVSGKLGLSDTSIDFERNFILAGASLLASTKNTEFSFNFDRDLLPVAGIDSLLISDSYSQNLTHRIGRGFFTTIGTKYTLFKLINTEDTQIKSLDINFSFSYALNKNAGLNIKYVYRYQKTDDLDPISENRIIFGIVGSF